MTAPTKQDLFKYLEAGFVPVSLVGAIFVVAMRWSSAEARLNVMETWKAEKIVEDKAVNKLLNRLDRRMYRFEIREGFKDVEPLEPLDEE